jgi:hypothetical protein
VKSLQEAIQEKLGCGPSNPKEGDRVETTKESRYPKGTQGIIIGLEDDCCGTILIVRLMESEEEFTIGQEDVRKI